MARCEESLHEVKYCTVTYVPLLIITTIAWQSYCQPSVSIEVFSPDHWGIPTEFIRSSNEPWCWSLLWIPDLLYYGRKKRFAVFTSVKAVALAVQLFVYICMCLLARNIDHVFSSRQVFSPCLFTGNCLLNALATVPRRIEVRGRGIHHSKAHVVFKSVGWLSFWPKVIQRSLIGVKPFKMLSFSGRKFNPHMQHIKRFV